MFFVVDVQRGAFGVVAHGFWYSGCMGSMISGISMISISIVQFEYAFASKVSITVMQGKYNPKSYRVECL